MVALNVVQVLSLELLDRTFSQRSVIGIAVVYQVSRIARQDVVCDAVLCHWNCRHLGRVDSLRLLDRTSNRWIRRRFGLAIEIGHDDV